MKKYYQLMILAVPLLFLVYICSVSAASGIAAYYVGPGEAYMATLDGRVRKITNTTSSTLFVPVRTLAEQQSFIINSPPGIGVALPCGDDFEYTDPRDSNVYSIVQIGTQCWMAENLRYLPSVVGPGTRSKTTPYYYVYAYNGTDVSVAKTTYSYNNYGALYNWPAALTACPSGWHLPSDAELTSLRNTTGDTKGGLIKAGWFTNVFGGFLEGWRGLWGGSADLTTEYWSSTPYGFDRAMTIGYVPGAEANIGYPLGTDKAGGHSVRCLRD